MLRAVLLAYDGVLVRRVDSRRAMVVAGAEELLASFVARGWMVGAVGAARLQEMHSALQQSRLSDIVKVVVSSESPGGGAHGARAYVRALEDFNSLPPLPDRLVHPHEVLALEASEAGTAAAAEAGLAVARIVAGEIAGLTAEAVETLYRGQE